MCVGPPPHFYFWFIFHYINPLMLAEGFALSEVSMSQHTFFLSQYLLLYRSHGCYFEGINEKAWSVLAS